MIPQSFKQWDTAPIRPLLLRKVQTKFIEVIDDYFTKYAEVETLAMIIENKINDFVWKSLVCRFSVPHVLTTDNGRQFDNVASAKLFYQTNMAIQIYSKTSITVGI